MKTLPAKWYIGVTEENRDELDRWRQKVATSCRDHELRANEHTLLSRHSIDESCYYASPVQDIRDDVDYNDYQEITLEQFRQITIQNPMTKSIQIPRKLLNEYYEAATTPQREYIINHFKLDGTTTEEAIRRLYDMACNTWKPRIMKNHPECFPEEAKHFDFSLYTAKSGDRGLIAEGNAAYLGLNEDFIRVRNNPKNKETHHRSFYLDSAYNWELTQDGTESGKPVMILIPTKKQN